MNELEDETEVVQKATPVEEEVERSEADEASTRKAENRSRSASHRCHEQRVSTEKIDCCATKRRRLADQRKLVKVYTFVDPCETEKREIIPRQCLTKTEYTDFLSSPKAIRKCPSPCAKKLSMRRLRAMPQRIEELARPTMRRLVRTLKEWGSVLPAEKVDYLIGIVENQSALTPEEAENFLQDQASVRKIKRKKKRRKRCTIGCPDEQSVRTTVTCGLTLDEEAVNCQYSMAQRLVRSILNWKCSIPRKEYRDITEVVLSRLSDALSYQPIGPEDRKSQQMRLLSDVVACWMTGVLVEVSEKHRVELERECLRRQREAEELATRKELEARLAAQDDDDDDDEPDDGFPDDDVQDNQSDDEDDDGRDCLAGREVPAESLRSETVVSLASLSRLDTDGETIELLDLITMSVDDEREREEAKEHAVLQECRDIDLQTEQPKQACAETETHDGELPAVGSREQQQDLQKMASRISSVLETDVPFVTFARIFECLYSMIECESENCLEDPMDNRVHRAIYEKFEQAIRNEDPALLTNRLRDLVDVCSGKLGKWLRKALSERQVEFLADHPGQVESREMRDWSRRILEVTRLVDDWSAWISQVADEATGMSCKSGRITRADWQNWTGKLEGNALLWRKAYLDALHEGHHDEMMLTCRKPVKTGQRVRLPQYLETTIKSTNLESCSARTR